MANSSIIGKIKNKIIREFIRDDEIIQAIDSMNVIIPENLIGTHIFTFHQNPNTLNNAETFITIQVHIPQAYYRDDVNKAFVKPVLEIWIISHVNHMRVRNIPKVTDNRNDYLSKLIDRKLNGKSDYGIGKLRLITNIEGSYQPDYVYRKMTFEGLDLNDSLCGDEE